VVFLHSVMSTYAVVIGRVNRHGKFVASLSALDANRHSCAHVSLSLVRVDW